MTQSTTAAEREVQHARAELSETINSLRHKLTPKELVEEVRTQFLAGGTDGLSRIADNFSRQAQDNPMALALASVGVGWLMLGRGRSHESYDSSDGYVRTAQDYAHRTSEGAGSALHRAGETAGSAAERASTGTRHAVEQARTNARSATRVAQSTARDMLYNYPLVVGAIAVAAGAAVGAALPSTQTEDEQFGETSDRVKERVSEQANQAAREASAAAQDVRDSVTGSGAKTDADRSSMQPAATERQANAGSATRAPKMGSGTP